MPLDFKINESFINLKDNNLTPLPEITPEESNPSLAFQNYLMSDSFKNLIDSDARKKRASFTTNEDRRNDIIKFGKDNLWYNQDMNILEAQYETQQTFLNKLKNTAIGASLIATDSFFQTIDSSITDVKNMFNDNPTYKTDATKALVETMENINNKFPIYKKLDEGFLNKSSNTIWETLPQIGFSLGTMAGTLAISAPATIIGGLLTPETGGSSAVAGFTIVGNSLKNGLTALRTLNGIKNTLNAMKALKIASGIIKLGARLNIASSAEAKVEAYTNYKDMMENLQSKGLSYSEADKIANASAEEVQSYNKKLLMLTNIADFIPFSKTLSKLADMYSVFKVGNKLVGKSIDDLTMKTFNNSLIKRGLNNFVIGGTVESFEEIAQGAGQKIISDFYQKNLNPEINMSGAQLIGDVLTELKDRVQTEEGIKEIASGYIIGGVMQGSGSLIRNTANQIGGKTANIFGGTTEYEDYEKQAEEYNKLLSKVKQNSEISKLFNAFYQKNKALSIHINNVNNALDNNDLFEAKSSEEKYKIDFFKFLHSTGLDQHFWDKMDDVNNLNQEEFKQFFKLDDDLSIEDVKKVNNKLKIQYENFKKTADNIDLLYKNFINERLTNKYKENTPENKQKIKDFLDAYEQSKYFLAGALHTNYQAKNRFKELFDETVEKTNQSDITNLFLNLNDSENNILNILQNSIEQTEQNIKNAKNTKDKINKPLIDSLNITLNELKNQKKFVESNFFKNGNVIEENSIFEFLNNPGEFKKLTDLFGFDNPSLITARKNIIDLLKIKKLENTSSNTYKIFSPEDSFLNVVKLFESLNKNKDTLSKEFQDEYEINKLKEKFNPKSKIKNYSSNELSKLLYYLINKDVDKYDDIDKNIYRYYKDTIKKLILRERKSSEQLVNNKLQEIKSLINIYNKKFNKINLNKITLQNKDSYYNNITQGYEKLISDIKIIEEELLKIENFKNFYYIEINEIEDIKKRIKNNKDTILSKIDSKFNYSSKSKTNNSKTNTIQEEDFDNFGELNNDEIIDSLKLKIEEIKLKLNDNPEDSNINNQLLEAYKELYNLVSDKEKKEIKKIIDSFDSSKVVFEDVDDIFSDNEEDLTYGTDELFKRFDEEEKKDKKSKEILDEIEKVKLELGNDIAQKFDIMSSIIQQEEDFAPKKIGISFYDLETKEREDVLQEEEFKKGTLDIITGEERDEKSDRIILRHSLEGKITNFFIQRFDEDSDGNIEYHLNKEGKLYEKILSFKLKALKESSSLEEAETKVQLYKEELRKKIKIINNWRKKSEQLYKEKGKEEHGKGIFIENVGTPKDVTEGLVSDNIQKNIGKLFIDLEVILGGKSSVNLTFNPVGRNEQFRLSFKNKNKKGTINIKSKLIKNIKLKNNYNYAQILQFLLKNFDDNINLITLLLPFDQKYTKSNIQILKKIADEFNNKEINETQFKEKIENFAKKHENKFISFSEIEKLSSEFVLDKLSKTFYGNSPNYINIIDDFFENINHIMIDKKNPDVIVDKQINAYFTFEPSSYNEPVKQSENKVINEIKSDINITFKDEKINYNFPIDDKIKNNNFLNITNLKKFLNKISKNTNNNLSKEKIKLINKLIEKLDSNIASKIKIYFEKVETDTNEELPFSYGTFNTITKIIRILDTDNSRNLDTVLNVLIEELTHAGLENIEINEKDKKIFNDNFKKIEDKIFEYLRSDNFKKYFESLDENEKKETIRQITYAFSKIQLNDDQIIEFINNKEKLINFLSDKDETNFSNYSKKVEFLASSVNGNNTYLNKFLLQIEKIDDNFIDKIIKTFKILINNLLGKDNNKIISNIYEQIFYLNIKKISNSIEDEQLKDYIEKEEQEEINQIKTNGENKNDIKGQVGTSNYTVDDGLIFYNNPNGTVTPVSNPKGKPVMDIIIDDIERRRQEEGIAALKAIKPGYNAFEDNGNAENATKALRYVYKLFGIEGYPEPSNFTVKNTAKSLSLDKVKENFLYHIIAGADRALLWKVVPFFAQNLDKIDNKNKAYLSVLIRWYNKELSDSEKEVNKYFNSNQANIDKANGAFYYQGMLSERKRVSLGYLPMLNVPNDREIFKRYNDYYSSLEQKNAMSESSQQSKERYYKAVEDVIINAKYDAELAKLEQSKGQKAEMPTMEEKKADIERRRQEELDKETPLKNENITVDFGEGVSVKYQVITYKDGSVKISTVNEKAKRYNELSDEVFKDYAKIDFKSGAKGIIKTELIKDDYTDKQSQEIKAAKEKTINAKYDAELKALKPSIETVSSLPIVETNDIEAKKADIQRREGFNGLEEIIFSNPNFRLEGFEIDGNYWNVITSTDRAKVLVNINGVIVPFYLTTGQAGKGLVPGWYPFFGIGKDGWLNKTDKSDMEAYYERYWGKNTADIVKSISEELNSFYGTEPSAFKNDGDPNATSRPLSTLADKVEDYINSKLNYTPAINNADARKTLRSNVEQLGKEINAKYDAELKALEEQSEQKNKSSSVEQSSEKIIISNTAIQNTKTIEEQKERFLKKRKRGNSNSYRPLKLKNEHLENKYNVLFNLNNRLFQKQIVDIISGYIIHLYKQKNNASVIYDYLNNIIDKNTIKNDLFNFIMDKIYDDKIELNNKEIILFDYFLSSQSEGNNEYDRSSFDYLMDVYFNLKYDLELKEIKKEEIKNDETLDLSKNDESEEEEIKNDETGTVLSKKEENELNEKYGDKVNIDPYEGSSPFIKRLLELVSKTDEINDYGFNNLSNPKEIFAIIINAVQGINTYDEFYAKLMNLSKTTNFKIYSNLLNYLNLFTSDNVLTVDQLYNFKRQIEVSFLNRAKLEYLALIRKNNDDKLTFTSSYVKESSVKNSFIEERIEKNIQSLVLNYEFIEDKNLNSNNEENIYKLFLKDFGFITNDNEFNQIYTNQNYDLISQFYKNLREYFPILKDEIYNNEVKFIVDKLKSLKGDNLALASNINNMIKLATLKSDENNNTTTSNINKEEIYEFSEYGNILNKLKDLKLFLSTAEGSSVLEKLSSFLPSYLQRFDPKYNPFLKSSRLLNKLENLNIVILGGEKVNEDSTLTKNMDSDQWWNYQMFNLLTRGFPEFMRAESKSTYLGLDYTKKTKSKFLINTVEEINNANYINSIENDFIDYLNYNFISFIESMYYYNSEDNLILNTHRINNGAISKSIFSYLDNEKFLYENEELTLKEILLLNQNTEDLEKLLKKDENNLSIVDKLFNSKKEFIKNYHKSFINGNNKNLGLLNHLQESDTFNYLKNNDYASPSFLRDINLLLKNKKITFEQYKNIIANVSYYNWVALNMEQLSLFSGDLIFFSNLHKRLGMDISTGTYLSTNSDVFYYHKQDYPNLSKINSISQNIENDENYESTIDDDADKIDSEIIKSSVIEDVISQSSLLGGVKHTIESFKSTPLYKGLKKSLSSKNSIITDEELFNNFKAYEKTNIADGEGFTDLDFYRRILMDTNEWFNIKNNDRPTGFEYIKAKERILKFKKLKFDYEKYKKYIKSTKTVEELIKEDELFIEDIENKLNKKEIYFDFPPLKLGAKGEVVKDGKLVMLGDKFSIFPLIYNEFTADTYLETIFEEMRISNTGYIKMKSGTKLDLYNELGQLNYDIEINSDAEYKLTDDNTHNVPSRFIKIQLKTPSKVKNITVFGTQFRTLITSFQYNKGKFINESNKKDLDELEKGVLEITNYYTKKLFDKLGIEDNGAFDSKDFSLLLEELKSIDETDFNFEIGENRKFYVDFKKSRDLFIEAFESREIPYDLQDILTLEGNSFKYNLESTTSKKIIENLLRGLVNKEILNQKTTGNNPVLVTSLFTAKKEENKIYNEWKKQLQQLINDNKEDSEEAQDLYYKISMYGTQGIAFYRTIERNGNTIVLPAECKKTFTSDYNNLLKLEIPKNIQELINIKLLENGQSLYFENDKLNSITNINTILKLIKKERINNKEFFNDELHKWYESNIYPSITIVSYRIPTQTYNSMEVFEINEFLNPYYGDILIPPAEIVVKAGSDYDIDKLSSLIPNINLEGVTEFLNDYNKNKEIIENYQNDENFDISELKKLNELEISNIEDVNKINNLDEELISLKKEYKLLTTNHDDLSKSNKLKKDELESKYFINNNLTNIKKGKTKDLSSLNTLFSLEKDQSKINERINELEELIKNNELERKKLIGENDKYFKKRNKILKSILGGESLKNIYQNNIIKNSINILLNINTYYELLLPSTTNIINKNGTAIKEVLRLKKGDTYADSIGNIKGFTSIIPQVQNLKFLTMNGSKKLLGAFAVNNKYLPLLQKINFPFNKLKDEKEFFLDVEYDKKTNTDEKIYLSSSKNENNDDIAIVHSEFVSFSVDAGSDDTLGFLNINMTNVGMFIFNLAKGSSPEKLYHFFEQPIIINYEKKQKQLKKETKNNNYKELYKRLFIDLNLIKVLNDAKFYNENYDFKEEDKQDNNGNFFKIKTYNTNKNNFNLLLQTILLYYSDKNNFRKDFGYNNFKELIVNYGNKGYVKNENIDNFLIALYNINFQRAMLYRQYQSKNLPDTKNFINAQETSERFDKAEAIGVGLIDPIYDTLLKNNTVISSFYKGNVFLGLSKLFFSFTNDTFLLEQINNILNLQNIIYTNQGLAKIKFLDSTQKENFKNLWNNEFLSFLTQNYEIKKGIKYGEIGENAIKDKNFIKNLKKAIEILIKNNHQNESLSTLLNNINVYNMYKGELNNFSDYYNIIFKNINNKEDVRNQLIETIRELYENSNYYQQYLEDSNLNLKNLLEKLSAALFFQSGFNKSIISSNQYLPLNLNIDIIQSAIDSFKGLSIEEKEKIIDIYNILFAIKNPNYFDFKINGKFNIVDKSENYRGKSYVSKEINLEEMLKISSINLLIENINSNFAKNNLNKLMKILNLKEC